MKPLFSLKFTTFLSIVLFVPFVMKTANSQLEPYPALLLPAGAGKLNLEEKIIKVNTIAIYGYDLQGKLQKIDSQEFLAPIPRHYLYAIVDNEFGLSTKTIDEIWLRGLGEKIERKRKPISPENQKLAKFWLSKRLSILGLSTSSILLRDEIKTLEINSGKELSREINNEKIISLH